MVKPPFDFLEIEREVHLWYSPIMVEPMFGITPESFDTIDMVPTFRPSSFFTDHDMVSADIEQGIGVPIVRIKKTPGSGMLEHQRNQTSLSPICYREGQYHAISLVDTEYHMFGGGSPSSLSMSFATEESFVHLDLAGKHLQLLDSRLEDHFPEDEEPSLDRFPVQRNLKTQPIYRYAHTEKF